MNINIKSTKIELTPSLKKYIETKVLSLEKILSRLEKNDGVEVVVEVGRTTKHHKTGNVYRAEININFQNNVLRAEHIGDDLHAAIDFAKDKIKLIITEFKDKFIERTRKGRPE